jgi:hypothetical protein
MPTSASLERPPARGAHDTSKRPHSWAYGTSTVVSPGASGSAQIFSTGPDVRMQADGQHVNENFRIP